MFETLKVIRCPGVNTDSLGNYLVGLGLISAIATRWPATRCCWIENEFTLLSSEVSSLDDVTKYLFQEWTPTSYKRWWTNSQKADTKAKSSERIWSERNACPSTEVSMLDAHIVSTGRNIFNPILGTGGNVGKRDLSKASSDAMKLTKKPSSNEWLRFTLNGNCEAVLPQLSNGGTWFVFANKTFNSGRTWSQDGLLSPWSVLLATEGSFLLSGGINRRLGARSRPYAVFPFITEPTSPSVAGDVAMATAEFWAPLWTSPSTLVELVAIIKRGLAQVGNRTARSPHEFAIAALSAGVDLGIKSFARFELRQTTSSQVYEAIPRSIQTVSGAASNESTLLIELIKNGWFDRMPFEPHDSKQRGKFIGLRGPIEESIMAVAMAPHDSERWQSLLLNLSTAQHKIDRNQRFRTTCVPIPLLSSRWFDKAWGESMPMEIEVAAAIASIGSSESNAVRLNIFGIDVLPRSRVVTWFPKVRPARAVWNTGDPLQNLLHVVQRRLIDCDDKEPAAFVGSFHCSIPAIKAFLCDELDLEIIARWIPPLSLINWSKSNFSRRRSNRQLAATGEELLHSLFRPIYTEGPLGFDESKFSINEQRKSSPQLRRRIFTLLRSDSIDEAFSIARSHYSSMRISIVNPLSIQCDGSRIAAAMLIPLHPADVLEGFRRWQIPVPFTNA